MHASSSSALLLRPRTRTRSRSRTFTSCTECRRRKQRCNQAKDRQCNNCARRYPPVVCTYQSLSPPPASDRAVDTRDANDASFRRQDISLACPADMSTRQPDFAVPSLLSSISISSSTSTSTPSSSYLSQSYYTVAEYPHYSPAEIPTQYTLTPTITPTLTTPGPYPGPDPYTISNYTPTPDWTTTASSCSSSSSTVQPSGYFPATTPEHWLSASGDPAGLAAADPGYFYVPEPEPDKRL